MSEKNNIIDLEGAKFALKPMGIFVLLNIIIVIAVHYVTFLNMKDELTENSDAIKKLEVQIQDQVENQIETQKSELNKLSQEFRVSIARIEGKLEILIDR